MTRPCAPVLLIGFNRPDVMRQVLARVRAARPAQLFVAVDGPRPGRTEDLDSCRHVRGLVDEVDWPCHIETRFRDHNLGCGHGVSDAVTWFFTRVESGIILEDDILASPSFFPYCTELLDRYRTEPRVMTIAGVNRLPDSGSTSNSYGFSLGIDVWGWASWRRAWSHYDFTMSAWDRRTGERALRRLWKSRTGAAFWSDMFDHVKAGDIDTWDFQWVHAVWAHRGVAAFPSVNLVSNVGFGPEATHTQNAPSVLSSPPAGDLALPLVHPTSIAVDWRAEQYILHHHYGVPPDPSVLDRTRRIARRLRSMATRARSKLARRPGGPC